jgi:hypothetical protein
VLTHLSWIPELTFAIEAAFFGATGAICITVPFAPPMAHLWRILVVDTARLCKVN